MPPADRSRAARKGRSGVFAAECPCARARPVRWGCTRSPYPGRDWERVEWCGGRHSEERYSAFGIRHSEERRSEFGRTAFGIRRSAFGRIGGFHPPAPSVALPGLTLTNHSVSPALPRRAGGASPPLAALEQPANQPSRQASPNAECRTPNADGRWPNANADGRTPNADRRSPIAERRSPIADRRMPNAECRMPMAEARTPTPHGTSSIRGSPNVVH